MAKQSERTRRLRHRKTQAAYVMNMKAQGYRRLSFWVPGEQVDAVKDAVHMVKSTWRRTDADCG